MGASQQLLGNMGINLPASLSSSSPAAAPQPPAALSAPQAANDQRLIELLRECMGLPVPTSKGRVLPLSKTRCFLAFQTRSGAACIQHKLQCLPQHAWSSA